MGVWRAVTMQLLYIFITSATTLDEQLERVAAGEGTLSPDTWMMVAKELQAAGKHDLALDAFVTAARLDPLLAAPHEEAAFILEHVYGDSSAAIPSYLSAIRRSSSNGRVYYALGNDASARGDSSRAATWHARAVSLSPEFFEAYNNLGSAYINLANAATDPSEVQANFREALTATAMAVRLQPWHRTPLMTALVCGQKTADWRFWGEHRSYLRAIFIQHLERGDRLLMPWQSSIFSLTPLQILANVQDMGSQAVQAVNNAKFPRILPPLSPSSSSSSLRLRVGYLSCSGFQGNTTTAVFIRGLFREHDPSRVESHCFARGAAPFPGKVDGSPPQTQIREQCGQYWDQTDAGIAETARLVQREQVHVLVDLTGWTLFPCVEVLAMEPAPVQIHWHGYPGSMGADYIQYLASDPVVSPPEHQAHYHEKLLFTAGSYLLNDHLLSRPEVLAPPDQPVRNASSGELIPAPTRQGLGAYLRGRGSDLFWVDGRGVKTEAEGFGEEDVILCCWNTVYKNDPRTLEAWLAALHAAPAAKLWLMLFDPTPPPNLALAAEAAGLDPSRLLWSSFFPRPLEFLVKGLAEVFVDTPWFNAHTTAVDALWSGTPLLTLPGEEFSARVGASLAWAESLPSLPATVVRDAEDYQEVLTQLVSRSARARALKKRVRERRESSKLYDTEWWVRSWESALFRAYELALEEVPPMHLSPTSP